jgi:NAD(P)-dependent dehydrogenase (short-subunit alcohol dehydrogenase family)
MTTNLTPEPHIGVAAALTNTPPTRTALSNFLLIDRVALITGAQRGIGLELSLSLAEAGAIVYCLDLPSPPDPGWAKVRDYVAKLPDIAPGVKGKGRLEYVSGDVTNQQQMWNIAEDIVKKEGRLDVCIANAGILRGAECLDYPAEEFRKASTSFPLLHFGPLLYTLWTFAHPHFILIGVPPPYLSPMTNTPSPHQLMDVNVNGVLFTAQAAGRQMEKLGTPGSIILIASMSGSITNYGQHWVAYNTSKSAVKQMARSMACELGPKRIRVNTISPGYIYTQCVPFPRLRSFFLEV